jgi:hypothetical protein
MFLCKYLIVFSAFVTSLRAAPEWSDSYTVFGTLSIPFAEIEEPFAAFADLSNGRSRIDYYGGMDKTFQRNDVGKFGTMFKVCKTRGNSNLRLMIIDELL